MTSILLYKFNRVRYPLRWQPRVGIIGVQRLLQFEKEKKVLGKIRATIAVPGTNFWSGKHNVASHMYVDTHVCSTVGDHCYNTI